MENRFSSERKLQWKIAFSSERELHCKIDFSSKRKLYWKIDSFLGTGIALEDF